MVRIPSSWARAGFAGLPGAQRQTGIAARRIPVPADEAYRNQVTVDLGNDGMAPQITLAGGTVTGTGILNPPIFTGLVAAPFQPGVPITIQWSVTLSGTVGAADVNNFSLQLPGQNLPFNIIANSVNAGTAGTYPQAAVTITPVQGSGPLHIIVGGSTPTSGAVYQATITVPGFGTAFIGPSSGGDLWSLDQCYLSTSIGQLDPAQCQVFAGALPVPQAAVTGSLAGGSSQFGLGGIGIPFGWFIWAIWTGGTGGSQANLRVTGVKTVLTN